MIKISEQEYERIKAAAKKNKNKRVDKKLQVLIMRHDNKGNDEISARTGYNVRYITTLMGQYKKQGLEEFIRIKQTSHNRNLSVEQEAKVLAKFEEEADAVFNTTLVYELSILKTYAEPLLYAVEESDENYKDVVRLLNLLKLVLPISSENIPRDSLLREFIGNSVFK